MHTKHLEHNTDYFAWIYAHGNHLSGFPQSAYYPLVYLEHNGEGAGKKSLKPKTTNPAFSY